MELYEHESGSNGTWGLVMTSQCDGRAAGKHSKSLKCTFSKEVSSAVFVKQAVYKTGTK